MRKHFAISALLSVSMILSSLSCIPGHTALAAGQTQGGIAAASISGKKAASTSDADQTASSTQSTMVSTASQTAAPQVLPADQNDPGYERLTGQYEPAAEENISGADSAVSTFSADAQGSGGFLSVNPATSGLKGYSSSVSAYTGKTYTHASNFDGMSIYNGIDVSYHQGTINWSKVKAAGIDFAILRLGYRGYSNGSLVTDSKFTTYIKDAAAAGIPLGVYFWTEAINVDEAIAEAQYVVSTLAPYQSSITMPVVIDWELNNNSRHGGLPKATNTAICSAFCDYVKQSGYTPMIYANVSDLNTNLDGEALGQKYEIWVARYNNIVNNATAQFYGNYSMWQYASSGSVDGISGNVDMNFWYTTGSPSSPVFAHGATPGAIATPTPTPVVDDVDSLDKVTGFSAKSAAKKLTLSWNDVEDADGYQIYRKDTYNGTYKKVKQISAPDVTTWTNSGLAKNHEYYYKIRAFHKNSDGTVYSGYTTLTAATKSSSQSGIVKKTFTLYKKPVKTAAKLMTLKKGMPVEYVGVTYRSDGSKFHHFRYHTSTKVYDGYAKTKSGLTYYTQGCTTAKLNLRKTAGTTGKLITSIPKNTFVPLLGTKKVKGTTWYKVCFSIKKNTVTTGYVAGNYIRK